MSKSQADIEIAKVASDIESLKSDSSKVQEGLARIYEVLSRIAVLEEARKSTNEHVHQLFELYHALNDAITQLKIQLSTLSGNLKGNTKTSDWVIRVVIAIVGPVATFVLMRIFK